jgi:D-alanyl-D-alanine carboxypeptidase/D-alanyl-D-alanine-endopeptidase (penicillin-binding protein 4)
MHPPQRATAVALLMLAIVLGGAPAGAEPPLQALADTVGAGQGVYAIAGDGTILLSQAADLPVHPASVTKVATTLALLERLGASHRFATVVRGTGPLQNGVVQGDLLVEASGDPLLVDEGALLLLDGLRGHGVRAVRGRLVVHGPLLLDWQPDPSGSRLESVLRGGTGGPARRALASTGRAGGGRYDTAPLTFHHGAAPADGHGEALLTYRSPPLLQVVKALNGYSNNVFHLAADAIGGPRAVEERARARVPPEMGAEIVIENGAGAGTANRLSPRAVVALLGALASDLARDGRDLTAVLPVSGIDPGTLEQRVLELRGVIVGKTGTFGSVGASALAGALRTPRYGVVLFAVLNHGVAVPEARARQDAFVRALVAATAAEPWSYTTPMASPYLEAEVR